jgi:hypothetical protein
MSETWINYWRLAKDGRLIKTERVPPKGSLYVYETAERPSPETSHHTFFCPQTGEMRKFDAASGRDRAVKRREIVSELLTKGEQILDMKP